MSTSPAMTENANPALEDLDTVGKGFVHSFFHTLNNSPDDLFKFFKDDSCFTFASQTVDNADSTSVFVQGPSFIRQAIASLNLGSIRCGKIDLITQPSGSNVSILTNGLWVTLPSRQVRQFVASFVLTASTLSLEHFYILNVS